MFVVLLGFLHSSSWGFFVGFFVVVFVVDFVVHVVGLRLCFPFLRS